jgi:hypothetical protein
MRRFFPARWRFSDYRQGPDRSVVIIPAAWLAAGLLAMSVAGCAGGGEPATTPSSPAASSASSTADMATPVPSISAAVSASGPNVQQIEITISGGTVSPPPGRINVARGERVRLVVHGDAADEVHVHGYDLEAPVAPGADAVIEFVADQSGLFEVETHQSGRVLTQLLVR